MENQEKNSGCSGTTIFLVILSSICLLIIFINNDKPDSTKSNQQPEKKEWYEGGTLHKAKIWEWKQATEENKLATCGDFVAHTYKEVSLPKSVALKACINEACKGTTAADNLDVSEVAASCTILLQNMK